MTAWLELLGRTLVHFVWQGALVAVLLAATLAMLRRRGPAVRYVACCAAMVAMVVFPAVTLARLFGPAADAGSTLAGPTPPPDPFSPLMPWLATFWLGGVSALQARTAYWWVSMRRLRRTGISRLPHEWDIRVTDLQHRLGLRRHVEVVRSTVAAVPMVVGWLRPVVLVPVQAFTGLDEDQLCAVLAHELAHVRRHDTWINLLQIAVETTLFFHPAVWWVSRQLRVEREYCCDDLAVRVCGDPMVFARALGRLDAMRDPSPALAATGGSLMQRIERLIHANDRPRTVSASSATGLVLASVALATGLLATGLAIAGDKHPAPPPPPPPAPAPLAVVAPAPPSHEPRPDAAPTAVLAPTPPSHEPTPDAVLAPAPRPPRPPGPPPRSSRDLRPAPPAPPAADPAIVPMIAPRPPAEAAPASKPARAAPPAEPSPAADPAIAAMPAPEAARRPRVPPPAAPGSVDAEIRRQIDDIRRFRLELEKREQRLIQLLEDRGERLKTNDPNRLEPETLPREH